jgi:uroporphyrinogen III methyltransferase/synthase
MAPERPLEGITIAVTRAKEQAGELSEKLRALGARVIEFPTIEIVPAEDYRPLDAALERLASYDWILFTSANGVRFFRERAEARGVKLDRFAGRICAIGPATRQAVEALGWRVDKVPDQYVAESLVAAFQGEDLAGRRILLPRAAVARDVLPAELGRLGAVVDVVEAYRTAVPKDIAARTREVFFGPRPPDWITFTSSSTVNNFVQFAGAAALEGVRIASIGPVTSAAIRRFGLAVAVEANPYTTDGLVEAIRLASRPGSSG